MDEKKYGEVSTLYRFFLSWRHASFASDLVVLYGVLSLTLSIYEKAPSVAWTIPLFASPVFLLLWMIDKRTRALYHAAIRAGKDMEDPGGGFFTHLSDEVVYPLGTSPFKITHSTALNVLFLGSFLLLLSASLILLFCGPRQ